MTETRPPKRARTRSVSSQEDQDVYYEDGNIVLAVKSEEEDDDGSMVQMTTYFRVHQSILAQHSQVFRDMFAVPQPTAADQDDAYDGLPVVHLHDTPEDLKAFLQCLYDPYFVPDDRYCDKYAQIILGPLVVATKYECDRLVDRVVARLRADWPTDAQTYIWRQEVAPRHGLRAHVDAILLVRTGNLERRLKGELGTMMYELYIDMVLCAMVSDPKHRAYGDLYPILIRGQAALHGVLATFSVTKFECLCKHDSSRTAQVAFILHALKDGLERCFFPLDERVDCRGSGR
ncbi:hypothetical protein HGRIS_013858 [Hohenbuehelia grisea]|uniref:BTB domain-containing protein n=1 Tax=Hohenbuehelia grisea TaxID=104357 RepID=A0ABR3IX15_9AGAR